MFSLCFNQKKTDVGFIPKATAPTTAVPCLMPTQPPVTQRAARSVRLRSCTPREIPLCKGVLLVQVLLVLLVQALQLSLLELYKR